VSAAGENCSRTVRFAVVIWAVHSRSSIVGRGVLRQGYGAYVDMNAIQ
jgi:hypothetical protein